MAHGSMQPNLARQVWLFLLQLCVHVVFVVQTLCHASLYPCGSARCADLGVCTLPQALVLTKS